MAAVCRKQDVKQGTSSRGLIGSGKVGVNRPMRLRRRRGDIGEQIAGQQTT